MKVKILIFVFTLQIISYSKVSLKIHEPIRFKNVNMSTLDELVVGEGIIEVSTDELEIDYGKNLSFKFPETGIMTNNKRFLKIQKFIMEEKDKIFKIENEKKLVKIYAIINRRDLNDGKTEAKLLEGEYIGNIPIVVSQYSKSEIIEK